jgi:hypothetical protein
MEEQIGGRGSIADVPRAEAVSAVIDRRDVLGGETLLHVAVHLCDVVQLRC